MSKKGRPNTYKKSSVKNSSKSFNFLKLFKVLIVILGFVGATSLAVNAYSKQSKIQHDLSVIGNGKPTVVEVHDPSCKLCKRLQSNLGKAKADFVDDIQFKTADITKRNGKAFSSKYQVPHVTLVFFDEKGELVESLQGVSSSDTIRENLEDLL